MKDNLKNCPFCDGEGKLETMLYGGTAVSCQNTDCGFYGYNVETSMWNTRPNDAWISVEDKLDKLVTIVTEIAHEQAHRDFSGGDWWVKIMREINGLYPPKQSREGE